MNEKVFNANGGSIGIKKRKRTKTQIEKINGLDNTNNCVNADQWCGFITLDDFTPDMYNELKINFKQGVYYNCPEQEISYKGLHGKIKTKTIKRRKTKSTKSKVKEIGVFVDFKNESQYGPIVKRFSTVRLLTQGTELTHRRLISKIELNIIKCFGTIKNFIDNYLEYQIDVKYERLLKNYDPRFGEKPVRHAKLVNNNIGIKSMPSKQAIKMFEEQGGYKTLKRCYLNSDMPVGGASFHKATFPPGQKFVMCSVCKQNNFSDEMIQSTRFSLPGSTFKLPQLNVPVNPGVFQIPGYSMAGLMAIKNRVALSQAPEKQVDIMEMLSKGMNCGFCGYDLQYIYTCHTVYGIAIPAIEWMYDFILSGLLEEMMTMGYDDFYDIMEPEDKDKLRVNDMDILNRAKYLNRAQLVLVGTDLTSEDRRLLVKNNNGVVLRPSAKLICEHPFLMAEYCILQQMINVKIGEKESNLIIGSIAPMQRENQTHLWHYCDSLISLPKDKNCCVLDQCEDEISGNVAFGPSNNSINLTSLVDIIKEQGNVLMITLDDNKIAALNEFDVYNKSLTERTYFIKGSGMGITVNKEVQDLLNNYGILSYNNEFYKITKIKQGEYFKVLSVSGPHSFQPFDLLETNMEDSTKLQLYLPDINSLFGSTPLLNLKLVQEKFEPALFRALCVNNMAGEMSYKDSMIFAVGFCKRRFEMHNQTVITSKINPKALELHVIYSLLVMRTNAHVKHTQLMFAKLLQYLGPTSGLFKYATSKLVPLVMEVMDEWLKTNYLIDIKTCLKALSNTKLENWLTGIVNNTNLENLLNVAKGITFKPVKIMFTDAVYEEDFKYNNVCKHHKPTCSHTIARNLTGCNCCHYAEPVSGSIYCRCCQPQQLNMINKHKDLVDMKTFEWKETIKINKKIVKQEREMPIDLIPKTPILLPEWQTIKPILKGIEFTNAMKHKNGCINCYNVKMYKSEIENLNVRQTVIDGKPALLIIPASHIINESEIKNDIRSLHFYLKSIGQSMLAITDTDKLYIQRRVVDDHLIYVVTENVSNDNVAEVNVKEDNTIEGENQTFETVIRKGTKDFKRLLFNNVIEVQTAMNFDTTYLSLLGPEFIAHLDQGKEYLNNINADNDGFFVIPHLKIGVYETKTRKFKIETIESVNTHGPLMCAFDALVQAGVPNVELSELKMLSGTENYFSTEEMQTYAENKNFNIIIMEFGKVLICKNDKNIDGFYVLVHSSAAVYSNLDEEIIHQLETNPDIPNVTVLDMIGQHNHFTTARLQIKEDLGFYLCARYPEEDKLRKEMFLTEEIPYEYILCEDKISKQMNKAIELSMIQALNIQDNVTRNVGDIKFIKLSDEYYLTNNIGKYNDIERNLIHVKVPDKFVELFKLLDVPYSELTQHSIMKEAYHRSLDIPDNLIQEKRDMIRRNILQIAQVKAGERQLTDLGIAWKKKEIARPIQSMLVISLGFNHKIKPLDRLIIKQNAESYNVIVSHVRGKNIYLPLVAKHEGQVEVICPQISTGSLWKQNITLICSNNDGKSLRDKLLNATCVLGVAGSNKTKDITEQAQSTDLIIAKTRMAVNNVKNRLKTNVQVKSVEKATSHKNSFDTLWIDEARMIDYMDILHISSFCKQIKMYGAIEQIGNIDMNSMAGTRHEKDLTSFVNTQNVEYRYKSFRFGEPFVSELKKIEPKIEGNELISTDYAYYALTSANLVDINTIVVEHKVTLVLTHYTINVLKLTNLINNEVNNIILSSTHSFQSQESDVVLLVLMRNEKGVWGLNGRRDYLLSGMTRCKSKCVVVSVDAPTNSTNLNDLLDVRAGALTIETKSILNTTIMNMDELSHTDIMMLNSLLPPTQGFKSEYKSINGGVEIQSVGLFGISGKAINKGKVITYEGSTLVTDQMKKNTHTTIMKLLDIKVEDNGANHVSRETEIPARNMNKVRHVAWFLDKFLSNRGVKLKLEEYQLEMRKTKGCATFCGIMLRINYNNWIKISTGYKNIMTRKIEILNNGHIGMNLLMKFLGLTKFLTFVKPELTTTWLRLFDGEATNAFNTLLERGAKFPELTLGLMQNYDTDDICASLNINNLAKLTACRQTQNIKLNDDPYNWQSTIDHDGFIDTKRSWLFADSYTFYSFDGSKPITLKANANLNEIREFILLACNDIRSRKIKGLEGLSLDNINGLQMSLAMHLDKNTSVGLEYKRLMIKLKNLSQQNVHDTMWLTIEGKQVMNKRIKESFPNALINYYNNLTAGEYVSDAIDQILLSSYGNVASGIKVAYIGSGGQGPYLQGKYYVKLISLPNDNILQGLYIQTLDTVRTMHQTYNKNGVNEINKHNSFENQETFHNIIAGMSINTLTKEQIMSLIDRTTNNVYGFIPLHDNETNELCGITSNNVFWCKGRPEAIRVKINLRDILDNGGLLTETETHIYLMTTIKSCLDGHIVRLFKVVKPKELTISMYDIKSSHDIIYVDLPWIDYDLSKIIEEGVTITTKRCAISRRMLKNMLFRLNTGEVEESKLLKYTQTLATTNIISDRSISDLYDVDVLTILNTAYYALLEHNNMINKFEIIINIMEGMKQNGTIQKALLDNLPTILSWVAGTTNTVMEVVKKQIESNKIFENTLQISSTEYNEEMQKTRSKIYDTKTVLKTLKFNVKTQTIIEGEEPEETVLYMADRQPTTKPLNTLYDLMKFVKDTGLSKHTNIEKEKLLSIERELTKTWTSNVKEYAHLLISYYDNIVAANQGVNKSFINNKVKEGYNVIYNLNDYLPHKNNYLVITDELLKDFDCDWLLDIKDTMDVRKFANIVRFLFAGLLGATYIDLNVLITEDFNMFPTNETGFVTDGHNMIDNWYFWSTHKDQRMFVLTYMCLLTFTNTHKSDHSNYVNIMNELIKQQTINYWATEKVVRETKGYLMCYFLIEYVHKIGPKPFKHFEIPLETRIISDKTRVHNVSKLLTQTKYELEMQFGRQKIIKFIGLDIIELKRMVKDNEAYSYYTYLTNDQPIENEGLIIHAFWDNPNIPKLVNDCYDTWCHFMTLKITNKLEDLTNRRNSDRLLFVWNKETSESEGFTSKEYDQLLPAHYSDIVRTGALTKYGGMYLDSTIIMTASVQPLINLVNQSATSKTLAYAKKNKHSNTIESWCLVCKPNDPFMSAWHIGIKEMFLEFGNKGDAYVEKMKNVLSKEDYKNIVEVIPALYRGYLAIYIVGGIIIAQNKHLEPIFLNRHGQVGPGKNFEYTGELIALALKNKTPESFIKEYGGLPFIKIIKSHKQALDELDDTSNSKILNGKIKTFELNNHDQLKEKHMNDLIPINNVTENSQSKSTIKIKNIKNYKNVILLISIGSAGDIIPLLNIYDLLSSRGLNPIIFTHFDHEKLIGERAFITMKTSWKTCMNKAITIMVDENLFTKIQGLSYYRELSEGMLTILDVNLIDVKLVIGSHMTPLIEQIADTYSAELILTTPFPWQQISYKSQELLSGLPNQGLEAGFGLKEQLLSNISNQVWQEKTNNMAVTENPRNNASWKTICTFEGKLINNLEWIDNRFQYTGALTRTNSVFPIDHRLKMELEQRNREDNILITFGSLNHQIIIERLQWILCVICDYNFFIVVNTYGLSESQILMLNDYKNKKNLKLVNGLNYETMLPYIGMCIHHGGAGLTQLCFSNRVISMITAVFGDQRIWQAVNESYKTGFTLQYKNEEQFKKNLSIYRNNYGLLQNRIDELDIKINTADLVNVLNMYVGAFKNKEIKLYKLEIEPYNKSLNGTNIEYFKLDKVKIDTKFTTGGQTAICSKFSLKYNPTSQEYCVREVLKQFINLNDLQVTDSLNKVLKPATNLEDLRGFLIERLINYVIINSLTRESEIMTFNVENPHVVIGIVGEGINYHAQLWSNVELQETIAEITNNYSNELTRIVQLERENTNTNNTVKTLPGKLKFKVCVHNVINGSTKIFRVSKIGGNTYVTDKNFIRGIKECFILTKNQEFHRVIVGRFDNDVVILKNPRTVCNDNTVLLDFGTLLKAESMSRRMIATDDYSMFALNKQTVAYLQSINHDLQTTKIISELHSNYVLLVSDFDNRSHHQYNERALIEKAYRVELITDRFITVKEMLSYYDEAINRMVLENGKIKYITETTTESAAKVILSLNGAIGKIVDNNVKTDTPIHEFVEMLIDRGFTRRSNHLESNKNNVNASKQEFEVEHQHIHDSINSLSKLWTHIKSTESFPIGHIQNLDEHIGILTDHRKTYYYAYDLGLMLETETRGGERLLWKDECNDTDAKSDDWFKLKDNEELVNRMMKMSDVKIVYMPVNQGKTTLASKYPHKYIDCDTMFEGKLEKMNEEKLELMTKEDWIKRTNTIKTHIRSRLTNNKANERILLTQHPSLMPDEFKEIGNELILLPTEGETDDKLRRKNIKDLLLVNKIPVKRVEFKSDNNKIINKHFKLHDEDMLTDGIKNLDDALALINLNIMNIEDLRIKTIDREQEPVLEWLPYVAAYEQIETGSNKEALEDFIPIEILQLWENTDLTDWVSAYGPMNEGAIRTRSMARKIKNVEKKLLTRYPLRSRPVLTNRVFEELNSITGRLYSVAKVRKGKPDTTEIINTMMKVYFRSDASVWFKKWMDEPLVFNPTDIAEWIQASKGGPKILQETIKLLSNELLYKPINDVNVHLKLESLLKDQPIMNWRQQQARVIVWQRKAVCALYSSIFKRVKERLKFLLNDKTIYADGLRPDELSARARLSNNVNGFFENDLSKQDRQTDDPIIEVEMKMYRLFGVHEIVISSWRYMHDMWRFQANQTRGKRESMRLTGQATTALGNVLTNMQVHAKFVKDNYSKIELMFFLGDDMLMLMNTKPNIEKLRNYIATYFNMQSKDHYYENYGSFCSMICYKIPGGHAEIGPDIVRLNHRFQVTNGVHEATELLLNMRSQSYAMMIGKTGEVMTLIENNKWGIEPMNWYDFDLMLKGVAYKYNMNIHQVLGYYNNLIKLMSERKTYSVNFRIFTEK